MARAQVSARHVLVVGAGGVFGSRLVAGLIRTTAFDVIVAGRHEGKLVALIEQLAQPARFTALVMDARKVTAADLVATGAFAVVDVAGPFQSGDLHLARTAIAAGLHFIDLADARDFVAGFGVLDASAKAAGVVAMSGASTTPALSNAALDAITAGWARVVRVEIAISPGNRAPRGLSVIQSILSYAGQPVRVFTEGAWGVRPGWGMMVHRTIPGVGRRFLSLSETPDLDIVPRRFHVEDGAVFRAGLELPVLHLGLWIASVAVRLGLVRSLAPFARPVRALATLFAPLGIDRGGMTVDAFGTDAEGRAAEGHWLLLAEAGDGPSVPILPALAALRALADGSLPPGAGACAGVLKLAAIEAEFAPYRITSRLQRGVAPPCLYRRVLGGAFDTMPEPIRRLHEPGWRLRARGRAKVGGPVGPIAAIFAALFRFPRAGDDVPLALDIVASDGCETWTRNFGGHGFTSVLSASTKPDQVNERFGPFVFELEMSIGAAGVLGMPVRGWRFGKLPLPRWLAPRSLAREDVDDQGRFRFDVQILLPLGLGRLVRYQGWLMCQ